jgi:hypothetical protein
MSAEAPISVFLGCGSHLGFCVAVLEHAVFSEKREANASLMFSKVFNNSDTLSVAPKILQTLKVLSTSSLGTKVQARQCTSDSLRRTVNVTHFPTFLHIFSQK